MADNQALSAATGFSFTSVKETLKAIPIPIPTSVSTPFGPGFAKFARANDGVWTVKLKDSHAIVYLQRGYVKIPAGSKCDTVFGPGTVRNSRPSGVYEVDIRSFEGTAFVHVRDIVPVSINSSIIPNASNLFQNIKNATRKYGSSLDESPQLQDAIARLQAAIEDHYGEISSLLPGSVDNLLTSVDSRLQETMSTASSLDKGQIALVQEAVENTRLRILELASKSDLAREATQVLVRANSLLMMLSARPEARKLAEQIQELVATRLNTSKIAALAADGTNRVGQRLEALDVESSFVSLSKTTEDAKGYLKQLEIIAREEGIDVDKLRNVDTATFINTANNYLPHITKTAANLLETSELYFKSLEENSQSRELISKAKTLIDEAQKGNLDAIGAKIADIKVQEWASWGESIYTDTQARSELVSEVKDKCLEYLLGVLPDIKVPPISGTKDGTNYVISDLDLSGFQIKKDDVEVVLGALGSEEVISMTAQNIHAFIPRLSWSYDKKTFPYMNGAGKANATVTGGAIRLGFKVVRIVRDGISIPRLALASKSIEIRDSLSLEIEGSFFSAIYNYLAKLFKNDIKDYILHKLEENMMIHMSTLMSSLNNFLKDSRKYWPALLRLTGITLERLPESASWRGGDDIPLAPGEVEVYFTMQFLGMRFDNSPLEEKAVVVDFVKLPSGEKGEAQSSGRVFPGQAVVAINGMSVSKLEKNEIFDLLRVLTRPIFVRFSAPITGKEAYEYEVAFTEKSLGLVLRQLTLSQNGVTVAGFGTGPEGGKSAAERSGKIEVGHLLVGVNNKPTNELTFKEVLEAIGTSPRPLTLKFSTMNPDLVVNFHDSEWPPAITFSCADGCVFVNGFKRLPSPAELSGKILVGDRVVAVNGQDLTDPVLEFADAMSIIRQQLALKAEGIQITFSRKSDTFSVSFPSGSLGISLGPDNQGRACVQSFLPGVGPAEKSGKVLPGLMLLKIGDYVLSSDIISEVEAMIKSLQPPYSLTLRSLDKMAELGLYGYANAM